MSVHVTNADDETLRKAKRLAWWSLSLMTGVVVLIYLFMGSSQAMKTAWMEDMLSLIPPIMFLIGCKASSKSPNSRYPYGYHRVVNIGFLVSSIALLAMGVSLLIDGAFKLISQEHPTIGAISIGDHTIWQGWVMIVVMCIGVTPPIILQRLKQPLANKLYDRLLYIDADMNRADWLTGLGAIVGVLGIALGWWWCDAAAASCIAFGIAYDGWKNLRIAGTQLMDHTPRKIDTKEIDPLVEKVHKALMEMPWITDFVVRLREQGHIYFGEVYVIPHSQEGLMQNISKAVETLKAIDRRVYDVTMMPVEDFPEHIKEAKNIS